MATEKGLSVLKAVHELLDYDIHVSTFKERKVSYSFYEDINNFSTINILPTYSWNDIKQGGISWLNQFNIWAIVCIGWRYMIPQKWINHLEGRVLIAHDSLLPKYRGFAPLASALINGEKKTGVTVMLAGEEVDSGDIVYQKEINISNNDTIKDLIKKVIPLFNKGVVNSLIKLNNGTIKRRKQNHARATYSIWRDENDLCINWEETSHSIDRKIRALSEPYLGTKTKLLNDEVIIQRAEVISDINFEIRQAGKIWKLTKEGKPIVVCGEGMLMITEAKIGDNSLFPMKNLRVRFK